MSKLPIAGEAEVVLRDGQSIECVLTVLEFGEAMIPRWRDPFV